MDSSNSEFSTSYLDPGQPDAQHAPPMEIAVEDIASLNERLRSVHFRSDTCEWATPQEFFDSLNKEFGFELDVCATEANAKCQRFFTKKEDGLVQAWTGVCWCNPPYGREIKFWMEKAMRTAKEGRATVVCLVPARTDTNWWHEYVSQADQVRFVKGRLKFGGHANSAPFPSAVVVFRARNSESVSATASMPEGPHDAS